MFGDQNRSVETVVPRNLMEDTKSTWSDDEEKGTCLALCPEIQNELWFSGHSGSSYFLSTTRTVADDCQVCCFVSLHDVADHPGVFLELEDCGGCVRRSAVRCVQSVQ